MTRRPAPRTRRAALAGFTLLEVMIGLGILGFSLMVLIRSASSSMLTAARAQMIGVVTDLSRGKMLDIEETLLKDGFTDTDQSEENKTFEEEGWKNITYSYKVEQVELPSWETLQGLTQDRGSGSGSDASAGSGGTNAFQDSALGGMLGQLGGGIGGGAASGNLDAMQGASFIQGQYTMVQEILKVSIRKITLTVTYKVGTGGDDEHLVTVLFLTDSAAMDKVLMGLGANELPDQSGGSGSGSGSGSSSGRGSGTSPRPTRGGGK